MNIKVNNYALTDEKLNDSNRLLCLQSLGNDKWASLPFCYSNDYLYRGIEFLISSSGSDNVFIVHNGSSATGSLHGAYVYNNTAGISSRPSLYLKPSVKIIGGSGTSNDPYTLSL